VMAGDRSSKRITVRLYEHHLEFVRRLRERLGLTDSDCIRFCVDLANLILNYSPFTDEMYRLLRDAVRLTLEAKGRQTKA